MISGVSAYSNAYSAYAPASARRAQAAETPFAVPASALRTEAAGAAGSTRPARDPVADSVELSRDFPQLLANPTYGPPQIRQIQRSAGTLEQASAAPSGGRATPGLGQELEDQTTGNAANAGIPGDPGSMNAGASGEAEDSETPESNDPANKKANGEDMDRGEQAQVRELKNRDREVRAHEQAHQAVGGAYAGGASYEFQQGPDGQRYAVGGEVSIDMSAERDPQATIAKMQQVKAAAMAPAEPSGQDRSVAASATATEMQARAELSASSSPAAAGGAGESGESGEGQSAEGTEGATAAGESQISGIGASESAQNLNSASARESESAGATNPFVEAYARQSRANNPYQINLPDAYRAINVVA